MTLTLDSTTAIIPVHLVNDIVAPGTAFGALFSPEVERRGVIDACNRACAKAREAGGLVVPLRIAFSPDYSDLNERVPLLAMAKQAGALKESEKGAELIESFELADEDVVITHTSPGPFASSTLQELLASRGVEKVIVCGVATNASVESTVREASDLGYATFLLEDASSAANMAAHEAAVESMGLFAQVITTAEL